MYDILIIGGGTAGLTCAIYAQRAGLETAVFEGYVPGGKIVNSPKIENYPAAPGISGYVYADTLLGQAEALGTKLIRETVREAELSGDVKRLITASDEYEGKTVVIANGASRKTAGFDGEKRFEGKGVSYCATCDGNFFRKKDVIVLGGGDTALEDASYLSGICGTVYVLTRGKFTGNLVLLDELKSRDNVKLMEDSTVIRAEGESFIEKAVIKTSDGEKELDVNGIFVAVGIAPDNAFLEPDIVLDRNGYIVAGEDCRTAVPGVFAAGDTRRKKLRQLVTAAADGAVAATEALMYIREKA